MLIPCMSYACYHHKQDETTVMKFGVIASVMINRLSSPLSSFIVAQFGERFLLRLGGSELLE